MKASVPIEWNCVTGRLLGYNPPERSQNRLRLTEHPSALPAAEHVPWSTVEDPTAALIRDDLELN